MCLAVPGRVLSLDDEGATTRSGRVGFGGIERRVSLAFVPDVRVGDYVLVHAGFALTRVDEAEAVKVFEYLKEIDAIAQELG
jgi:hydrogenase expression/formation protein HypC